MSDTTCSIKGCERPRHTRADGKTGSMCQDHARAMSRSNSATYREAQKKRAAASYEARKAALEAARAQADAQERVRIEAELRRLEPEIRALAERLGLAVE